MKLAERIDAFGKLGERLSSLSLSERHSLEAGMRNENAWFTAENVQRALKGIAHLLDRQGLERWTKGLNEPSTPREVGMVMAGNLPAVGFHDYLTVLICGHKLRLRLSHQDSVLPNFIHHQLIAIAPGFADRVIFADQLKGVEAVIATGSDNTARYFEYYFRNIPHIIRKNRNSLAVIQGDEPAVELEKLGEDVFSYFGLGCRNVSKLFLPSEFDLDLLRQAWSPFASLADHHKYANNYDYQKALLIMNQQLFSDFGFLLLVESPQLASPVSVLNIERYHSLSGLKQTIHALSDRTQVVVSAGGWFAGSEAFGQAQYPAVTSYADGIDTIAFLSKI